MIRAKLFKNTDSVSDKYFDVAERVEDFINSNSVDDVISIVRNVCYLVALNLLTLLIYC